MTASRRLVGCLAAALALALTAAPAAAQDITTAHGIAMHGEPLYGPDFDHFAYVDPDAPKGGAVVLGATGGFDSFNPFIVKGTPAVGLGLIYQTLMTNSGDETFTYYGALAKTVTYPEDRSWVEFALRPEARWHDGQPITAADVVWTFETLVEKGTPFYRAYYGNVAQAEIVDERTVRFTFTESDNRELPLIMGQLIVLPKHYWQERDFQTTTLEPPLGSGAYRIADFDSGRAITYERVADWWAADLPVNRGQYNFDRIAYDYYRDGTVVFEAFKAGNIDFRRENVSLNWARGYDVPAAENGQIVKGEFPDPGAQPMQGWAFNSRRPIFQDRRVRQALGQLFDFEWLNRNIFFGLYARTDSFFENTELAATGLPRGEELAVLERFRDRLPADLFTEPFAPPVSDGSGNIRRQLRAALALLDAAGWELRDGTLTNRETGQPFAFEILLNGPSLERVAQPYIRNLERAGIQASLRIVDTSQYINRVDSFDFDMVSLLALQSLSPGNEQRDFWGSAAAQAPGSRNLAGISDPVVDALIELIIEAPDRDSLIARTRALDRVLLSGHYVIPQYHNASIWLAYWDRFGRPETLPEHATVPYLTAWWVDPDKDAALAAAGVSRR